MPLPSIIDLADVKHPDQTHLGKKALALLKLKQLDLAVPKTAVIPVETLEQVFEHANLTRIFEQVFSQLEHFPDKTVGASTRLQQAILSAEWPHRLQLEIISYLHTHFNNQYVAVRSSEPASNDPGFHHASLNIHGEQNIFAELAHIWAMEYRPEIVTLRKNSWPKQKIPTALLIQTMIQADSSGIAFTHAPTTSKKQHLEVISTWGVHDHLTGAEQDVDRFIFDVRSEAVVSQSVVPKPVRKVRSHGELLEYQVSKEKTYQASLMPQQLDLLCQKLIVLKRKVRTPHLVEWALKDGTLFFLNMEKHHGDDAELDLKTMVRSKTLPGTSLNTGTTIGVATVALKKPYQIKYDNTVLVVKEVTVAVAAAAATATALISEQKQIAPSILSQLRQLSIPILFNVEDATTHIKDGAHVLVDTNHHSVTVLNTQRHSKNLSQPIKSIPSLTKVYISAGDPSQAETYLQTTADGVGIFKSEFTFIQQGIHPLSAARDPKKKARLVRSLEKALTRFLSVRQTPLPLVYRCNTLTSSERATLEPKTAEPREQNPEFGFRGGLFFLNHPEALAVELTALNNIVTKNRHPKKIGLLIPFVRSIHEIHLITNILESSHPNLLKKVDLWIELATPELLHTGHLYLKKPHRAFKGFSVNAPLIISLLQGLDPDHHATLELYRPNLELLKQLLDVFQQKVHTGSQEIKPLLQLELSTLERELIEYAGGCQWHSIVVPPRFAERAKELVTDPSGL